MRLMSTSLLALLAASPALADDFYTQAPVAAVTVYPQGAELIHRASLDLPAGDHRVFLPYAGLDDMGALPRIRTSEGVAIGALGFQPGVALAEGALDTPAQADARAEVKAAEDTLAGAEDTLAAARAEVEALEARLDFLAKVTPGEGATLDELLATADAVKNQTAASRTALVTARAALRPFEQARDKAVTALDAARAALDRLAPPGTRADMLAVEVSVASAGPVTLELTELTQRASWQMDYDLDLDREAGRLDIARKLVVTQYTGSAWTDVALTLSTARPGEDVAPSQVNPDRASIYEPRELARASGAEMAMEPAPMMEPAMVADSVAGMTTASLQVDGLSLTYAYPNAVSIASDEAAELALDHLALDAEPAVQASPRWDDTAFTVATFTNTSGEPILPGPANILRDGHLVGRDSIAMIPAGAEETLAFGPIDGIRLDTTFLRNAEGDTGIISKSNTREQRIAFSVENLTGEEQDVRALFPLTFSEQEDLRVKVTASPQPDETDLDNRRGVSAWDMTLAPGEKKEVNITVNLDWPEGQTLEWYP